MEAIFKLKREGDVEDTIPVCPEEKPSTFANKVGEFSDVSEITIEFINTGKHIPAFVYTEEELEQFNVVVEEITTNGLEAIVPPDQGCIAPVFPTTGKYFSPLLKTQLQKFTQLQKLSIVSNNVIEDDSFPTEYTVEIMSAKSMPRVVVQNISTPDDLYALMTTTNAVELADSYTLMNDIDMTGYVSPSRSIGPSTTYPFTGNFNGQGFTIKIGTTTGAYGGLFGILGGSANISDVNVVYTASGGNVLATFNGITFSGQSYVGGFCAGNVLPVTYITITNCNVLYEGNATQTGTRNAGFGNAFYSTVSPEFMKFTNCNVTCNGNLVSAGGSGARIGGFAANSSGGNFENCKAIIKGSLTSGNNETIFGGFLGIAFGNATVTNCSIEIDSIYSLAGLAGGFIGASQSSMNIITGCNVAIGTLELYSAVGASFFAGGFIGQHSGINISNCNLNIDSCTISGNIIGGFYGIIVNQLVENCNVNIGTINLNGTRCGVIGGQMQGGGACTGITANIKGNALIKGVDYSSVFGVIDNSNVSNIVVSFLDDVLFSATEVGAIAGAIVSSPISESVVTFNKKVIMQSTLCGGVCGYNAGSVANCAVFFGDEVQVIATNFGGICGNNLNLLIDCTAVYNAYNVSAQFKSAVASANTGTITTCYTNTYSTNTSVIPNTNTNNIINTLNSNASTEWSSGLLNIRQSLDTANNSTYLSHIFSTSPLVATIAKNNALTAGMTFAGVPYINTTTSVIEPLLAKYRSPLPETIRYTAQNDVNEIDISELAAYYIYQNPAYIIPPNKTITSSTEGDGSIAFDTDVVPVGSSTTINDVIYNVRGVGSSLIEVSTPEPGPAPTSNTLSVIFAIIAGVILLIVIGFSYVWGWQGYMILPSVIAITMIVLAIVYAF